MLKNVLILIILIHLVFLVYFLSFVQFFQQDEWLTFTNILSQGSNYLGLDKNYFDVLFGQRTGGRIIFFTLFNLFGLNPTPYGLLAFSLHATNTGLVFLITRILTNKKSIALLASIFFLVNEAGNEAYSWFSAMNSSAPALMFFLLSLLFYIKFLRNKKIIFALVSLLFLSASLFFKESSIFALIFYPILFFIYNQNKKNIIQFLKVSFPVFLLGIFFFIYFLNSVLFIPGSRANYIDTGKSLLPSLLIHSLQYPLEGIVNTVIPNYFLFLLSPFTTMLLEPSLSKNSLEFLVASQDKYAEITTILILLILGGTILLLLKKKWKILRYDIKNTLISSIIMSALSFLPYIVLNRSFAYFDSRHYYIASAGMSIFLATLLLTLISNRKIFKTIIFLIIVGYIALNEYVLISDFKLMTERSQERQNFLRQFESQVPQLKQNSVFFITGNSAGYYGLEELKVPFQSGLGNILAIQYVTKSQLNPSFLAKEGELGFLYDILGQGYKEVGLQGFGYYYSAKKLRKAIDQKLFSKDDVITLFYNSEAKELKKIESYE